MARRCFFSEKIEPGAEFVNLSPEASHHLEHVLRMHAGQSVEIRDGMGNAWKGEVAETGKGKTTVRLTERLGLDFVEPALEITLALALARSDIMDMVVRQATELGISKLVAFRSARSQYSLTGSRSENKSARWLRIAREALCQCGRTRVPEIVLFDNLDNFLGSLPPYGAEDGGPAPGLTGREMMPGTQGLRIAALESERVKGLTNIKKIRPSCSKVLALIGPEGGWDDFEMAMISDAGFYPTHLGPRILRFETAAVALVSMIHLLWGDFGEQAKNGSGKDEMY